MNKEIIRLLKSSNPQDRIRGIRELEQSGHPDTIKILGSLYKKETDPNVKKLAAQTARKIKEAQANDPGFFDAAPTGSGYDPEQAKVYLERAMDCVIDLQAEEARQWGQKAFAADPDLANDEYAQGVAAEITGVDKSIAVETLMGNHNVGMSNKPKRGEKAKIGADERVSWGKALAGIGVYAVLVAIVSALPFFVFAGAMGSIIAAFDPSASSEAAVASGAMMFVAIGTAIASLIGVFIGIFIQYGMVHFSATTFLGGRGYFTNLLWNLRIPLIAQFILQVLIIGFMFTTLISAFATIDPAALEAASNTGDLSYIPGFEENASLINTLNLVNSLVSLGFAIWISIVIGNTYDFGGVKGCLSIIIANIVMFVAICGCYFVIIMTVLNAVPQSY